MRRICLACMLTWALAGCASTATRVVEATSFLGTPLLSSDIPATTRAKLESNLAAARAVFNADPSEDNTIWLGRRLAYLGRYSESIATFSHGLETHPASAKLLRHRGHRYITVRRLDDAIRDLGWATDSIRHQPDEVEPDGAPNARNIPRSTLNSNIWYHLGLAHYLKGSFEHAAKAWGMCMNFSRVNDDMLVATSYWLYLSLTRSGDHTGAATALQGIRREMDILENHAYHRLLLCFKGDLTPDQVGRGTDPIADTTIAYGLAIDKLINGDAAAAHSGFERIISGPHWAAFGYIAAEAELARRK